METREKRIKTLLQRQFEPVELSVVDESHKHIGHAGAQPEGETHYRIEVVGSAFESLSRVQRHRAINEALSTEFAAGLHALSIKVFTPQEREVD